MNILILVFIDLYLQNANALSGLSYCDNPSTLQRQNYYLDSFGQPRSRVIQGLGR